MAKLYNLARVHVHTTDTGTIILGSAVPGYLSFAQAGLKDGDGVLYVIVDGLNNEIGRGIYSIAGPRLTRQVIQSTNNNNPISLSEIAEVYISEVIGTGLSGAASQVEQGPGISLVNQRVGIGLNSILLARANGSAASEYMTIVDAMSGATNGDEVYVPVGEFREDVSIPDGVIVVGQGKNTIIQGTVTLGAGSGLRDLAVEVSGSGTQAAVIGPESGEGRLERCLVTVESSDDEAMGVKVGAGNVVIWDCHIVTDGDTSSHCVRLTANGDAYLHYTRFTHPAAGTSFVEPSPGGEYYSDQGWTIVQPGSSVVALDGHDDVNRGTFSTLQLDTGYVLPGSDTITWRVGSNGIAYIYTQWSDNGTDWNTDWVGSYAINSGGEFISITRPNYGRYMRMVRYDGNTNPFFAWASVNNYIYNDVTGHVYTQACTGDTAGTIPLAGDRAAYDATGYPELHANDTDSVAGSLHHTLGSAETQAAAGNHDHGTRTENVLVSQGASGGLLKDSHILDGISGAYLAELAATLTGNRTYTLQDADMTLAALNLAQVFSQAQTFEMGNGRVVIDPDTSTPIVMVRSASTGTYMQVTIYRSSAGAGGFIFRHARGTESSPSALASGDDQMLMEGYGYDGGAFRQGAAIRFLVNGTVGTDDMPTDIRFLTRAAGASGASTKMSLTGAGALGIGTTSPSSTLDVVGDAEVGSGNYVYWGDPSTNGSWRIGRSGNNLVMERRESGSWVTKSTVSA